jgi:hypothetical protein
MVIAVFATTISLLPGGPVRLFASLALAARCSPAPRADSPALARGRARAPTTQPAAARPRRRATAPHRRRGRIANYAARPHRHYAATPTTAATLQGQRLPRRCKANDCRDAATPTTAATLQGRIPRSRCGVWRRRSRAGGNVAMPLLRWSSVAMPQCRDSLPSRFRRKGCNVATRAATSPRGPQRRHEGCNATTPAAGPLHHLTPPPQLLTPPPQLRTALPSPSGAAECITLPAWTSR